VSYLNEKEYIGQLDYLVVSGYDKAPVESRIRFEGVIDSKPVISHSPSRKPLRIMIVRYYVNTRFTVDGVKVHYEGPAFLKKGQEITLWGKKKHDHFEAVKIECEDYIIQIE
jgi:hypothetical protein